MKSRMKKLLALFVCICMLMSGTVYAQEGNNTGAESSDLNEQKTEADTNAETEKPENTEQEKPAPVDSTEANTTDSEEAKTEINTNAAQQQIAEIAETAQEATVAVDDVEINETNFPDANFRSYVSEKFDKDKDGTLSAGEIGAVAKISVEWKHISDLTGIEYFTSLTSLSCGGNQLTILDVSKNENLEASSQAIFQDKFASYYGLSILPKGWSFERLDALCTVKGGKRLPADCELIGTSTEHPYIRVRDVGNSRYICLTNQFQYIDEETYAAISRYTVNENDIIISTVGTIGLIGKIHTSLDGANLTENCVKLANIQTVTSDYLYCTLCHKKQTKEIKLSTVGAVQAKLPMYNIQSMQIVVPPVEVIQEFQKQMDVFNAQIEANTLEIQKLYVLKDVLLAKLSGLSR